jgi:hypothetical protein
MASDIPLARNVRRIGHLDLPGGGQVVVQGDHAFIGHMKPPHGTTIVDIADPTKPRVVAQISLPDSYSHTHKVRVVGDLMYVNVEQNERHFLRKAQALPGLRAQLAGELGRDPTDAEIAAALKVEPGDIARLDAARARGYRDGGFKIYDISDIARPRENGQPAPQTNDVDVDTRGLIYLIGRLEGFDILEYQG